MANPYFNAAYYLGQNPDLTIGGITAATAEEHYNVYGAAEGRAPNSWFDSQAYLLSNTDLIAAGVTKATALQHFTDYGVREGRIFNNNPALAPSNFTAAAYAAANTDVATALGITDPANPTDTQKADLLSHFLAYGINEDRSGAGSFGDAAKVPAIPVATDGTVTVGTAGDDTFAWAVTGASDNVSVNGLAGTDTLQITGLNVAVTGAVQVASVEKIDVSASGTTAAINVAGAGVQSLKVANAATTGVFSYAGAKVNSVEVNQGTLAANFTSGASGTADALDAKLGNGATLTVSGIEQVNAALASPTAAAVTATINANAVNGSALTFNLTGGTAGQTVTTTLDSVGSASLNTVTVNAASVLGNQTIDLSAGDLANVNAVVTTGAGDDNITTGTIAGKTATVNAGAGNDTINASAGIDIMTGGAGADTFAFGAVTNAAVRMDTAGTKIQDVDTIKDFTAADTGITFTALTAVTAPFAGVDSVTGGVLKFSTGFLDGKDLTAVVTALDEAISTANQGALFNFEGSAYLFVSGDATTTADITNDGLIKLTGVNADLLEITATNSVAFI